MHVYEWNMHRKNPTSILIRRPRKLHFLLNVTNIRIDGHLYSQSKKGIFNLTFYVSSLIQQMLIIFCHYCQIMHKKYQYNLCSIPSYMAITHRFYNLSFIWFYTNFPWVIRWILCHNECWLGCSKISCNVLECLLLVKIANFSVKYLIEYTAERCWSVS